MSCSQRKLEANRRNAQHSTGPRTPAGKARSSRNATTHSLFCQDLLLPQEEAEVFHALRHSLLLRFHPQDAAELHQVDQILSSMWRLRRLQAAESLLYQAQEQDLQQAQEEQEYQTHSLHSRLYPHEPNEPTAPPPALPPAAILAATFNSEHNPFERLQRYEQRLQNSLHRSLRQLRMLQNEAKEHDPHYPPLRV